MFWQEDTNKKEYQIPKDIIDLVFDLKCKKLPVDHVYHLQQALSQTLPWMKNDTDIAIHSIHLAGAQNGWERPDPSLGQMLILSKRTKMTIRVSKERQQELQDQLNGITLDINGYPLTIGKAKTKELSKQTTIFARYLALENGEDQDENQFMLRIGKTLQQRGIDVKKALCGVVASFDTPEGKIMTRSIMLSGMKVEDSVKLQQSGIGSHRQMGCGIFIPHKGIEAVKKSYDDEE